MHHYMNLNNIYSIGTCGVFVITIFVILITQYKHLSSVFKNKKKKTNGKSDETKTNETQEKENKKSHLADCYTSNQLEEIRRSVIKLHNFNPHEEIGAGEPARFNEREQLQQHTFDLIKPSNIQDQNDFDDGDSMLVNVPGNNEQDDIMMDDIAPDDITISEDEVEEESGTHISPQAVADIEAELLDFSILNGSVDAEESDADRQEEEAVVKVMEGILHFVTDSFSTKLCMQALVEVILSDNDIKINEENYLLDRDKNLQNVTINSDRINKFPTGFVEIPIENSQVEDCNKFFSNCDFSSQLGREFQDQDSYFSNNKVSNFGLDSFHVENSECMPIGIGENAQCILAGEYHTLDNARSCNYIHAPQIETGFNVWINPLSSASLKKSSSFLDATELVACYIARKLVFEAVEECMTSLKQTKDTSLRLNEKLNKISKIQTEKKKLTPTQLAEEQRIQQSQLAEIFALMERNPHMFGDATKETMNEQASLYCV